MMGAAMRRKRTGGGSGGAGSEGSLGRTLLTALLVLLAGSGSGYLYATQVAFPVEREAPVVLETVPDLRELGLSEARNRLEGLGFVLTRVDSIRHPRVNEGRILGQSPLPGQLALPGAEVELTVSLGAERRPVPDVTRLTEERAVTVLRTAGFSVTVDSIRDSSPSGQVVTTVPAPGVRVNLPADIRITVSLGPPTLPMPAVVGLSEAEARELLESVGLRVGEVEYRARFGLSDGDILESFPGAGIEVPEGSAVRLVVRRRSLLPGGGEG